jgi:hypothetical protein
VSSEESTPTPRHRFIFRIVLGIIGLTLLLQTGGVLIRERQIYYPYVVHRGSFVRTTGTVTAMEDGHISYEFLHGAGSREFSSDLYAVGEPIELDFLLSNPDISYLRDEEPLFIEIFLETIGTLLGLGLVYWAIPKKKGPPADDAL